MRRDVIFKGCGTALVTPFKADGSVDYAALSALVRRQKEGGVDFLVPLATTGETPTLLADEKKEVFRVVKENAGALPIVVGAGSNSVPATLGNIRLLEPLGPDALLIVVPFYNKPTQEGQYLYFKAVASQTELPVIIYNVPGRTGANMLPDTVIRLAEDVPNIVGIKEASGNFEQVCEIIRRAPEGFSVLSGDDDMTFRLMAEGACGVISVASNVVPSAMAAMTSALLSGKLEEAGLIDERLSPLFKACFVESNPIPVKAALCHLGLMEATVRLPLSEATDRTKSLMKDILGNINK